MDTMQQRYRRGLRNNRSPSQQELMGSSHRRLSTNTGNMPSNRMLRQSLPPQPPLSSRPRLDEPQFLARSSTHSGITTSNHSLTATSSASVNRRGSMQSILNGSRRGLRHKNHDALVRKVSVSSMECGSGHSSKSDEGAILTTSERDSRPGLIRDDRPMNVGVVRPGLDREISGLEDSMSDFRPFLNRDGMSDSQSSFYGDEMNTSATSTDSQVHRTFEDVSMEAQSSHGNAADEQYDLEISPGVYLPFRGSQETWRAVEGGYAMESTCLECGIDLVSVPDCQCVVCPDCRMVNPVFEHPPGTKTIHGVGMGFQKDWIQRRRQQGRDFS